MCVCLGETDQFESYLFAEEKMIPELEKLIQQEKSDENGFRIRLITDSLLVPY